MSKNISVFLNESFVGALTQFLDGRTIFVFDQEYLQNHERPTLSLSYKNVIADLQSDAQRPYMGLPPFFSNLLPEGRLRKYLAAKAGIKEGQEYKLLMALRDDLPGAVILKADNQNHSSSADREADRQERTGSEDALRFSLAGVQMKFSGDLKEDKIVIPASGVGGHWIVKLPSLSYPHVVELEYAMLTLAKNVGIAVPEFRLVQTEEIENLPKDIPEALQGDSLISKRFDRTNGGGRIHMEDFAQVFGVTDKYDEKFNYQSIANVIWQEIGLEAVLEFVRRLVHMILTGNADMHLKNWSVIYPDTRHAKLAPAYDFVSTTVYGDISTTLPHSIAGVRNFSEIGLEVFKNFAKLAQLPERSVLACVSETVDATKEHWIGMKNDLGIPSSFVRLIDEHMGTVPIATQRATAVSVLQPVPQSTTWPGSFIDWHIQFDSGVPDGKIVFRNQAGTSIEMDAPRRMVEVLLLKHVHQILRERNDFANQLVVGYVGLKLYDEWRQETFIRIPSRMVLNGIDENALRKPKLNLRITFFPIAWRKLQHHFNSSRQSLDIDFLLKNGELWTVETTIGSLSEAEASSDGTRIADVRLYCKEARKLYVAPQDNRIKLAVERHQSAQEQKAPDAKPRKDSGKKGN